MMAGMQMPRLVCAYISGGGGRDASPGRVTEHGCSAPVQVSIPLWALVHLPVVVTITTAMFTPKVRA